MTELAQAVQRFERAKEEFRSAESALRVVVTQESLDTRGVLGWRVTPELRGKIAAIIAMICSETGVSEDEVFGRDRSAVVARSRMLAMVFLRRVLGLRLTQVAKLFSRDHGTVINAERSIDADRETDKQFAVLFNSLSKKCQDL